MNYSNMIEEKKLKKGFIIATLISTVIGTFTASMNLHDKLQEKKDKKAQQALDRKQDDQIQKLRETIDNLHSDNQSLRKGSVNGSLSRRGSVSSKRGRITGGDDSSDDSDGYNRSAKKSRAMIEEQYDDYMQRVGPRYAQGDVITENKLQAQIIQLQQAVINVLQDAVMDGRSLSKADVSKLIAAQQAARDGSLDALDGQYMRLITEEQTRSKSVSAPKRQLTLPSPQQRERSLSPVRRVRTLPLPPPSLYCPYSEDLQYIPKNPISSSFSPGGSHSCPACGVRINIDSQNTWIFESAGDRNVPDVRITARFILKCHTEAGEFACLLCHRYRDVDSICGNPESLVRHLGQVHSIEQMEREEDLVLLERA